MSLDAGGGAVLQQAPTGQHVEASAIMWGSVSNLWGSVNNMWGTVSNMWAVPTICVGQ